MAGGIRARQVGEVQDHPDDGEVLRDRVWGERPEARPGDALLLDPGPDVLRPNLVGPHRLERA